LTYRDKRRRPLPISLSGNGFGVSWAEGPRTLSLSGCDNA